MPRPIGVALLFLLLAATLLLTVQRAVPQQGSSLPGARPRTQFAPYYTVDEGFGTMLMLNNATRAPFVVTVTLYSLKGSTAVLAPIPLDAHETKEIGLAHVVAGLGGEFRTGSLRLDYTSVGYGLGAMAMMVNGPESLELDVLARPPGAMKSSRLESLWWTPDSAAQTRFVVQNTTAAQVNGALSLTDASGNGLNSSTVTLDPHETRVFNLQELAHGVKTTRGGISVSHNGPPGALLAQGFIIQRQLGFSANLQFEDPATFGDSKLEGAGVLVGSAEAGSAGPRFTGHLLLRNASSYPVTVNPILQRGSFVQPLGPATLQSGEVQEIIVPADSLPDRSDASGIEVQHTGPPGSVIGYWFSADPTGNLVVETPLRSPAPNAMGAGNNPWSLEGDSSPTLYVKNTGAKAASSVIDILYAGGKYAIGLREIPAGETLAVDLRKLRDDRVPDVFRHTLPPDLVKGQVRWTWHGGPPLIGRVNTVSLSTGIASNMSCPGCCCQPSSVSITLAPSSILGPPGGSTQETATETDLGCSGPQTFPLSPSSLAWSSSNSTVASVNTGSVNCLTPGTAIIAGSESVVLATDSTTPYEECRCNAVPDNPAGNSDVTVVQVQVTTADIVNDQIVVSLSPATASGRLVVTTQGAGSNPAIFDGIISGGNYTYSFNRNTLAVGQYTAVNATWTVNGSSFTGSKSVSFYVMGVYRHSQYNSPTESACVGSPARAYITNPSCAFNPTTLRNDFISQSWLNGSGITINFGPEQDEAFCLTQSGAPVDASGRSFRPGPIVPSCRTFVGDSTVAKGDDAPLICGDSVLIVGLGGTATTKTVTDRCPACTGKLQLDNYTTQLACQPGTIPDLGNYLTIRLR